MTIHVNRLSANMTQVVTDKGHTVLFSYETPVAALVDDCYVKTSRQYSPTTNRHISRWLNGHQARLVDQELIDSLTDPFVAITTV